MNQHKNKHYEKPGAAAELAALDGFKCFPQSVVPCRGTEKKQHNVNQGKNSAAVLEKNFKRALGSVK